MEPRETDGFTYSISGTGVGTVVEVGRPVEVGITIGRAGAVSVAARGVVPHPVRINESIVNRMAMRVISPPIKVWWSLYNNEVNEKGRPFRPSLFAYFAI